MMGLVPKESHRSWGFLIGVNTQHTSSVSSFSQHRWVLEALGRKELIWECSLHACSCVDGCHHLKKAVLNFPSGRPHVLLPGTELLGLGFVYLVTLMWYGLTEQWEGLYSQAVLWGLIVAPRLPPMFSCSYVIWKWWPVGTESSSSVRHDWRLCSVGLSNT